MVNERLNILMLVKPFDKKIPKLREKMGIYRQLEEYANVHYWSRDGDIKDILAQLDVVPDFIYQYEVAWDHIFSPVVTNLNKVDIPKGCFVGDPHWNPPGRLAYVEENEIDLIFSATKRPFLNIFPQYEARLRWLPHSIDPSVMKDWGMKKDIDFLLMGLVSTDDPDLMVHFQPPRGTYPFREKILEKMKYEPNFVFHPHSGHLAVGENLMINKKYARELNRANIFFTCGGAMPFGAYAVLKFFEAPACKTLLLAESNPDIEELGFVDGVNFVDCNRNDFYEKGQFYLHDEEARKCITESGYRFIHKYHTDDVRAKKFMSDIKDCLDKK